LYKNGFNCKQCCRKEAKEALTLMYKSWKFLQKRGNAAAVVVLPAISEASTLWETIALAYPASFNMHVYR
jgi:hypothetical protein